MGNRGHKTKRQHYLPATLLGGFSTDVGPVARHRKIWAGDRRSGRVFCAAINQVALESFFYEGHDPEDTQRTEKHFQFVESRLSDAIAKLIDRTRRLDAAVWLHVLVPFAAGALVRSVDFGYRYSRRGPGLPANRANTNGSRHFELQRLLALVTVAEWIVWHFDEPIAVPDTGWFGGMGIQLGNTGILIPLDSRHALHIRPLSRRAVLKRHSEVWSAPIAHREMNETAHKWILETTMRSAVRYVFAQDRSIVDGLLRLRQRDSTPILDPHTFGFLSDTKLAREYEFTWHRLALAIGSGQRIEDGYPFPLDFPSATPPWLPMVIIPTLRPNQHRHALICAGESVTMNLADLPGVNLPPFPFVGNVAFQYIHGESEKLQQLTSHVWSQPAMPPLQGDFAHGMYVGWTEARKRRLGAVPGKRRAGNETPPGRRLALPAVSPPADGSQSTR